MGNRYYPPQKNKNAGLIALGVIILLVIITNLIPLLVMIGVGAGAYYLITEKSRKQKKLYQTQILQLDTSLKKSEQELQGLGQLLDRQEYLQFEKVAKRLLQGLTSLSYTAHSLQPHMEVGHFTAISQRINNQKVAIQQQLQQLHISPDSQPATSEEEMILRMAPEIIQTHRNIQTDHQLILKKITEADNAAELKALHETNMKRFKDILDGYLRIKASPKDYYNADERLHQAKIALEQFDLDLDETLRQLNESELKDFEISLRMMNTQKTENHPFSTSSDVY